MIITVINVVVYARRVDLPKHIPCWQWLQHLVEGSIRFSLPHTTQSGFVRLVTDPRVFKVPTPLTDALRFIESIRNSPEFQSIAPGQQHWEIFSGLCMATNARGKLIPDAYLAALAIEAGAELATCDRDFAKFPGLRWFDPSS